MTHQELLRASPRVEPGKRQQRAWQVRGLFAVVAVIAITATLTFWHPGPACQGVLRPAVHSKPVPRRARFGLIPDEFFNAYPRTPRWSDGSFTATFWWPYPSAVVHASAKA